VKQGVLMSFPVLAYRGDEATRDQLDEHFASVEQMHK
jgi:hypothetical protein